MNKIEVAASGAGTGGLTVAVLRVGGFRVGGGCRSVGPGAGAGADSAPISTGPRGPRRRTAVAAVDDADRENEGDLIFAAELATPELVRSWSGYTSRLHLRGR